MHSWIMDPQTDLKFGSFGSKTMISDGCHVCFAWIRGSHGVVPSHGATSEDVLLDFIQRLTAELDGKVLSQEHLGRFVDWWSCGRSAT